MGVTIEYITKTEDSLAAALVPDSQPWLFEHITLQIQDRHAAASPG